MASEVDICNIALAHLGDDATVASLDPPEGSAQAEHCARFYPVARDSLLEMHTWAFASRRIALAPLGSGWQEWRFAYAQPADALNIIAVLPPDATDDYSVDGAMGGRYVPQPFSCETNANGADVIYTNQENAVLRYSALVVDTTRFSPLFVMTLSWHLASMLAGPMLKGDAGATEAKRCIAMMQGFLAKATISDAGQRRIKPKQHVSWIAER